MEPRDFISLPNLGINDTKPLRFYEDDIQVRILKLKINKSSGGDGIHPRILYKMRSELACPLKIIYS